MAELLQQKSALGGLGHTNITSASLTLDSPATEGNLLVACLGGEKYTDEIFVPAGWNIAAPYYAGPSVSGIMVWKKAEGGEQDITIAWTNGQRWGQIWAGEYSGITNPTLDVYSSGNSSNTNVFSQSAGSSTPTTVPVLAVAYLALDSSYTPAKGEVVWSDSFNAIYDSPRPHGSPVTQTGYPLLAVAHKEVSVIEAITTTATWTVEHDQAVAQIGVFRGDEEPEDPTGKPTVTSIVIPSTGDKAVITFSEDVMPETGITGFSVTINGDAREITVERTSPNQITLSFDSPVYSGHTASVSYAPGNVTDLESVALDPLITTATNNSTISPPATVVWRWSGAITNNSASVVARLSAESSNVKLMVYDQSGEILITESGLKEASLANNNTVRMDVYGLSDDTRYLCYVESDGEEDRDKPVSFRTFPTPGFPVSFSFAFASCANTGSNHTVFTRIKNRNPRFFIHLGDLHYQDIGTNNIDLFRSAYNSVLTSSTQSGLYSNVPVDYIWDDHDYGPNNSNAFSPGREASCAAYRENVPHYTLPSTNDAIYHSFVFGRVRFVVTDLRSEKAKHTDADGPSKRVMSQEQEDWFVSELDSAREAGQVIIWANTFPWIGINEDESWPSYAYHRSHIANLIKNANMGSRVAIISGDSHMIAADDGTNSDYATDGGAAMPVCHAAALDRSGSVKGGPYSQGTLGGGGQYGIMIVNDEGGETINFSFAGYNQSDVETISLNFSATPLGISYPHTPTISIENYNESSATLQSSDFSDEDTNDNHTFSQWQLTNSSDTDFSIPIIDTGDDPDNLLTYTVSDLESGHSYIARVRHRDSSGLYSLWSPSVSFSTPGAYPLMYVFSAPPGESIEAAFMLPGGSFVGDTISAGISEVGGGWYIFSAIVPEGLRGALLLRPSGGGDPYAVFAVNPEEGENLNEKVSEPKSIQLDQIVPVSDLTGKKTQTIGDCLSSTRADSVGKWAILDDVLTIYGPDDEIVRSFIIDDANNPTMRS